MKIKYSFISNSSSSSFIVLRKDFVKPKENLLTLEQIKKLENFGFFKTSHSYPSQISWQNEEKERSFIKVNDYYNYGYGVDCNQYEPIKFLLKNCISFSASIHYNQESWIYDGKTDKLTIAQNLGEQLLMGFSFEEFKEIILKERIFRRTTGKEYLKKEKEKW